MKICIKNFGVRMGAVGLGLFSVLLGTNSTDASRVAYDMLGSCEISGAITSVELQPEYRNPCLDDPSTCTTGGIDRSPEKYQIGVDLESLNCKQGEKNPAESYESTFKKNEINNFTLDASSVINREDIKVGNIISGIVVYPDRLESYEIKSLEKKELTKQIERIGLDKNTNDSLFWEETADTSIIPRDFEAKVYSLLPIIILFILKCS